MLKKKKLTIPDWLEEADLLTMLLSHATTKYEYYASRSRLFTDKYGTDILSFKKQIEEAKDESFTAWDDLISWEAYETAAKEWQARSEELHACLQS